MLFCERIPNETLFRRLREDGFAKVPLGLGTPAELLFAIANGASQAARLRET